MATDHRYVPTNIVDDLEAFVEKELRDAEQYSNREPLDESGVYSLYRLAARIYAAGFEDGERITQRRESSARLRRKEAADSTDSES